MINSRGEGEFFRVVSGEMSALGAVGAPQSLGLDLGAVRARRVMDEPTCDRLVRQLSAAGAGLLTTEFPAPFGCRVRGRALDLTVDPDTYFVEAERFEGELEVVAPELTFARHIQSALEHLTGERVAPAALPDGRRFMPFTLREHPEGAFIPLHVDREQLGREPCRALRAVIDPEQVLAFTLCLSAPEGGGELRVHDVAFDEVQAGYLDTKGRSRLEGVVHGRRSRTVALEVGDLVLFNSGAFAHEVTAVTGARARWAAVGFLARARQTEELWCWG